MEESVCRVTLGNLTKEYKKGTTYSEIAREFQPDYEHQIVLAMVDGYHLRELRKTVEKDCEIHFLTTADSIGNDTYRRSLCFLFIKAFHDISGHDLKHRVRIRVHFTMGPGFYCTVDKKEKPDETFLAKVEARMRELAKMAIPIQKRCIDTGEAVELFHKYGMYDKERLFAYRRVSKVNLYSINEFEDYFYGYMVPDTGYLKYFALYPYEDGVVIQMPSKEDPETVPPFEPYNKLFQVRHEAIRWGDLQEIDTVGALNDRITTSDMKEVVLVQEAHQEREIGEIAKKIASRKNVKFVLIAGPSSSGKTTFSHRLSIQLKVNGLRPHPIAVDNYFVD